MKKYVVLPVNDAKKSERYYLKNSENEILYDFTASIDEETPAFDVYMDVTRFGEETIKVTSESGKEISVREDFRLPELDEIRGCKFLRPLVHFTPKIGWMNDPNGMVYMNGEYHFFFQHNPYSRNWGNMTWGHAVSKDLFHWEEKGDAIFPDEMGTVFSGSGFCDTKNDAGFGKDAMILFYTAAGNDSYLSKGKNFTQCIAYSNDNGETYSKYSGNPFIDWIKGANRDPKVEWCPELGKYVLALYLDGDEFEIFTSDNLLDWTHWEYIHMQGDNECPAFYPLETEGERKWIFQGAHDRYFVGSIRDGRYVIEQEELPYHMGSISYAPQAFSGTPFRVIRMAWIQSNVEGTVFNSQAGIPTEFFLKKAEGKIRLGSLPVREIENIKKKSFVKILNGTEKLEFGDPNSMRVGGMDVSVEIGDKCGPFTLSCFGTEIKVDPEKNEYSHGNLTAPLSYDGEKNIRVIFDTLTAEVFADGGLVYSTYKSIADRTQNIKVMPEGSVNLKIKADVLEL